MPLNVRYPSAVDYTLALQHPDAAFSDPELRGAVFAKGFMGPEGIAGSSAVVFRAAIGGTDYALRCYTREDASTPDRYAALDTYVSVSRLSKYVGAVTWYDREVLVKGARWPVLTMEWIAGQHLNEYVGYLADDGNTAALRTLADRWLALVGDLQQAQFAHGDLQHGNVLVDSDGQLRLVDFDSVWIPPLRGRPAPTETGHASYQPPDATAAGRWGPYMDTFPGLVIYLALTALAKSPELWGKLNNGDNLLFERQDFAPPHDTEIWTLLAELADPEIDRLAARLKQYCAPGWVASTTLQGTVKQNWWERPGTAPVPAARPAGAAASGMPAAPSSGPVTPRVALPPPPTGPYQSPIADRPRIPAGPAGPGTWWNAAPAPRLTPKTVPTFTPVTAAKQPRPDHDTLPLSIRHHQAVVLAQRVLGAVLVIAGLVSSGLLASQHHMLRGIALGTLLAVAGVLLAMINVTVKGKAKRT